MSVEQLPSGLFVVESPKEEPPTPPKLIVDGQCAQCGKECHQAYCFGNPSGFQAATPTCRHGRYLTCDACYEKKLWPGCPVCSCKEDYT